MEEMEQEKKRREEEEKERKERMEKIEHQFDTDAKHQFEKDKEAMREARKAALSDEDDKAADGAKDDGNAAEMRVEGKERVKEAVRAGVVEPEA